MIFLVRNLMLKYFNWSHIQSISKAQLFYYWVVVFIPIIFAFLQQISPLLEAYKESGRFILEFRQMPFEGTVVAKESKDMLSVLYGLKKRFFTWEVSMQIAFFGSLFLMFATALHNTAPKITNKFSKREYELVMLKEIDQSSNEFLSSRYSEAINRIEVYEKHFNIRFNAWPDTIIMESREAEYKTVEMASKMHYDVESTRRIGLFIITNIFYLFGFILIGMVLFARMIVVLQGV